MIETGISGVLMGAEYRASVIGYVRFAQFMQAVKTNTNKKSHMQQLYCGNLMKSLITVCMHGSHSWEPHSLFPGPGSCNDKESAWKLTPNY